MTKVNDIQAVAKRFNGDRFRLMTNNELLLLAFIELLGDEATTGNLIHAMVIASGRGVTFGQVTTPLKKLAGFGLVQAKRGKSESSGKMVDFFTLTDSAKKVLDLSFQAVDVLKLATHRRASTRTVEQVTEKRPSELAMAAAQAAHGKLEAPTPKAAAKAAPRASRTASKATPAPKPSKTKRNPAQPTFLDEGEE